MRDDLTQTFELVFEDGLKQRIIDRPVEIVFREVEGLPKGTVKAVIDAYGELVDEGCLVVFGPSITDNCVPTSEAIEQRFHVPAISVTGSEDWLGEWTFAFPMGSLTDEPIFWTDLLAKGGHDEVGVLVEQSLVGETYIKSFARACRDTGIRIVAEERIAQTAQDVGDAVRRVHEAKPSALVHCGFGFGILHVNAALEELGWDPPRFTGTAFQNAWINPVLWKAILGWTGIDQYDEGNLVGQHFLDQYEGGYGRRPQYCVPVVNRDIATVLLRAFADAHPLSPRGVKEALERVKMLPAAAGAPGTRISVREVDPPRLDGRRLPRGAKARSGRDQHAPRRSLRSGLTPMATEQTPRPSTAEPDRRTRSDRSRPRYGSSSSSPSLGVIAYNARTGAVSPRIANPEVTGAPASGGVPVRDWTTGSSSMQVGTVVMMLALIAVCVRAWRRRPGHPYRADGAGIDGDRLAGPDHELGALRGLQPAALALARGLAAREAVADRRAVRRHRLRDLLLRRPVLPGDLDPAPPPGAASADSFVWRHPLLSLALLVFVVGFVFDAILEIFSRPRRAVHLLAGHTVGLALRRNDVPVPADLGVRARHRGDDPGRRPLLPGRHRTHAGREAGPEASLAPRAARRSARSW